MPLFLLALSSLLLSCGTEEFHFNPYEGTDGVTVEFLDHAPPEELYTTALGEPLEIGIKVSNLGASDIPTAYITLATEQDYVTLTNWDVPVEDVDILGANQQRMAFPLKGKSYENPFGTEETFSAFATARIADPQLETIETQLLASVCYPYQTQMHGTVCIDTDPNNLRNRVKLCAVDSLSFSGQGAPVAITKVKEEILSAGADFIRPQFTITIENLGDGTVLSADAVSTACSSAAVDPKLFSSIALTDVQLSGFSLKRGHFDCRPLPIRLDDHAQTEVTCTLKPGLIPAAQDSYTTDLAVTLDYGYMTSAATQFRLRLE